MSIIGLLLGWTGLPKIVQELLMIAACCLAVWLVGAYVHHRIYAEGITAQQAADQKVSAAAIASAAAATQAAQEAANRAEESYREEVASNTAAAAAHPIGPVRLCIDTHVSYPGVPETSAAVAGAKSSGTSSRRLPRLPSGDSGVRPQPGNDVGGLLDAWAQKADSVSAELREIQSRGNSP